MKNIKNFLASFMVAVMVLTASPLSGFVGLELNFDWLDFNTKASATTYTGTCGENVNWSYDSSTYTLTISGTGAMDDYDSYSDRPWESYEYDIKTVVINYGVTSIGPSAFRGCTSLTSITIPNSVTHIGNSAFAYCDSLTSITIPDSVTSIGGYAFGSCTGLTSITIPDSVTTISNSIFSYCDSLTSVTIPDSVITIDKYAFDFCESLTSITIPDSVTTIGDSAFAYCGSLTSVTIPDSVTKIGDSAFNYCSGLTNVTIPDSVTSIGSEAFYWCENLASITVDKNNKYYSNDEHGVLFDKGKTILIQYPMGNTKANYTIPDSVKSISDRAFGWCDRLTSVTIPDSVKTIGENAFVRCEGLTSMTIGDGVTSIGNYAIAYCISLTDVTIGDSVTNIGDHAFSTCESLTSITIPDSVTSIGNYAIASCSSLSSVTIGDSVTNIGDYAFGTCESLTNITIPDSVTTIGNYAFSWCEKLTSVEVGRGVSSLAENTFYECTNLTLYGYKNSYTETYAAENEIDFVPFTSKVTFNANGGTTEATSRELYTDYALGDLPTAQKSDGVFLGWYTKPSGGELVTADTVITQDCTLYAQWGDPVTSVSLVMPSGVTYYVGDSLEDAGIKLKVTYYDGTTKTISSGFSLTPKSLTASGIQTVTATYGNHSATAKITVQAVYPTAVSAYKLPEKTTYLVGEEFNPKGLRLKVVYNNSTEKIIDDMSALEIVYDFSSAGESIVYFAYEENGITVADYFDVLVYKKPTVSADSVNVVAGETVTVPVRISGNCGLMGYNVSVRYDSELLTPVSATQGSAISGGLFDSSIETSQDNSFNVIWSGSENVKNNGVLFNLVFEVNEKAVGDTSVDLDFVQADTFNESFDDIQLTVNDAVISISNPDFEENTLLVMQDTSGEAGEVITLPVIMSNYTDVTATTVKLEYDSENFTFVNAQSDTLSVKATDKGSYVLIKLSGISSSLDGAEVMQVNFRAKEYIEGEFDFDLTYDESLDTYAQKVVCNGCTATLTNPSADEMTSVYSEKVNATLGERIIVPVRIRNNHGIMGYRMIIDYDYEAIVPVSVTAGSSFSGNFAENSSSIAGRIYVVWNANSEVTVDGDLFYIEFEVMKQGDTTVSVSYVQEDTFNEAWEDVVLDCKDIEITVHPADLIFAKNGTSAVVDKANKFIYGLPAGCTSLTSFISVADGYAFSVTGKVGTGATVNVTKNGEVAETYTVIIFGDVNGDGWYDGMDAVLVSCIVNGMLEQADEAILFAADCNHDGEVSEEDVLILDQAGVLLIEIDQTQDAQMLETQSAYIDYVELIDQTVEVETEDKSEEKPENETEAEPETEEIFIIKLIESIFAWIMKLFSAFESIV